MAENMTEKKIDLSYFENTKYKDVILMSNDGIKFHCFKQYLIDYSDIFNKLFENETHSVQDIINMDCSSYKLYRFLSTFHLGKKNVKISYGNIEDIIELCFKYDLNWDKCSKYIKESGYISIVLVHIIYNNTDMSKQFEIFDKINPKYIDNPLYKTLPNGFHVKHNEYFMRTYPDLLQKFEHMRFELGKLYNPKNKYDVFKKGPKIQSDVFFK